MTSRSEQPHMRNVAKATAHRVKRADMKRQLAAGALVGAELIRGGGGPEWEPVVGATRWRVMLEAVPGIGPSTTDEILDALGIDGRLQLRTCTYDLRARGASLVRQALGQEAAPL